MARCVWWTHTDRYTNKQTNACVQYDKWYSISWNFFFIPLPEYTTTNVLFLHSPLFFLRNRNKCTWTDSEIHKFCLKATKVKNSATTTRELGMHNSINKPKISLLVAHYVRRARARVRKFLFKYGMSASFEMQSEERERERENTELSRCSKMIIC